MIKLTKKMEYALMALKFIASNKGDKLVTAREICDELNIPFDTVAKVMQVMGTHCILQSVKGIKGGYSLSKNLNDISFCEIEDIIEGNSSKSPCQTYKGICELHGSCNIIGPVENLNKKIYEYLSGLNLEELLMTSKG